VHCLLLIDLLGKSSCATARPAAKQATASAAAAMVGRSVVFWPAGGSLRKTTFLIIVICTIVLLVQSFEGSFASLGQSHRRQRRNDAPQR